MEMLWLANKGAFPAKIRTKVLIYLGNQKAKMHDLAIAP